MTTFKFTSPDGKVYRVTPPEGVTATREQAFQMLQARMRAKSGASNAARDEAVQKYRQEQIDELNPLTAGLLSAGETVSRGVRGVKDLLARATGDSGTLEELARRDRKSVV